MSEAIRSLGLCSTCRHAPSCTYQRDPKRPVFNCEEFEIEVGEPARLSGRDLVSSGPSPGAGSPGALLQAPHLKTLRSRAARRPATHDIAPAGAGDEDDFARYRGLCGNCDNRESCTFPKPEGGVWHCEEYR